MRFMASVESHEVHGFYGGFVVKGVRKTYHCGGVTVYHWRDDRGRMAGGVGTVWERERTVQV